MRLLAKEIVASRRTVARLHENKAQMNSVSMMLTEQLATLRSVGHLEKSAEVLAAMNGLVRHADVRDSMREMSKEMAKSGLIEELVNDALEDVNGVDDLEAETDAEVNKILAELAGETGGTKLGGWLVCPAASGALHPKLRVRRSALFWQQASALVAQEADDLTWEQFEYHYRELTRSRLVQLLNGVPSAFVTEEILTSKSAGHGDVRAEGEAHLFRALSEPMGRFGRGAHEVEGKAARHCVFGTLGGWAQQCGLHGARARAAAPLFLRTGGSGACRRGVRVEGAHER